MSVNTSSTLSYDEMMSTLLEDDELRQSWEESTIARAIANQVIRYRVEHGLSQRALAARLGVSPGLVGRLEVGEHEPRLRTLQLLTRRLGLRFNIDIHPVGTPGRLSPNDQHVEQVTTNGVETLIYAIS